jgi:hypothetical protein
VSQEDRAFFLLDPQDSWRELEASVSPTQRSLKLMRDEGFTVAVVEKWIPGANVRKDLFDCWDIACVGNGRFSLIQVTTLSHISERLKKVTDHPVTGELRKAGVGLFIHGWRKLKTGWEAKVIDVS